MVNMCFLVNEEELVVGEQTQKPGGKCSHYAVLRGCVVAMGLEGRFANWASDCPHKQPAGFLGCIALYFWNCIYCNVKDNKCFPPRVMMV